MAKLRRLNGKEVIKILESLGFTVRRITGSHHHLYLTQSEKPCYTSVPVHGGRPLSVGTLKSIYRQVSRCVPDDVLYLHFYTD